MSLVPYREWSPFLQLRDEVNRLFSTMQGEETSGATANWVPAVDIHEYDDRFALFVDVPGVDPGQVEITLDNGVLTLAGQRNTEKPAGNQTDVPMRIERGSGAFHRRFILPDSIDGEQIKAVGRNGVLEISIPKQAKAQPRRIKVA
ncbi:MAG TPA: Hsp20/alpha crystallin family protein [Steroidobacteraceae bacterium]|jgi:HSP20 family protein